MIEKLKQNLSANRATHTYGYYVQNNDIMRWAENRIHEIKHLVDDVDQLAAKYFCSVYANKMPEDDGLRRCPEAYF